jgi:hypothetical protein
MGKAAGELLAVLMSRVIAFFIEMMVEAGDAVSSGSAARTYELNVVSSLPVPRLVESDAAELRSHAVSIWKQLRGLDSGRETSRYFTFPFRSISLGKGNSLKSLAARVEAEAEDVFVQVLEESWTVEKKVRHLFDLDADALMQVDREIGVHPCSFREQEGLAGEDGLRSALEANTEDIIDEEVEETGGSRAVTKKCYYADRHLELLCHVFKAHPKSVVSTKRSLGVLSRNSVLRVSKDVISYLVGVAVGRWNPQAGLDAVLKDSDAGPFDPPPTCPPALRPGSSDTEDCGMYSPKCGVLPDDPDHSDDIVRRVREILELVWKGRAEVIEKEACEILGVKELREYFRKPGNGGFWNDHVSRYSKSRRKAPIYWLLQSSKKNYALWLYYHRLDKDLLFKALVNYVEPKIQRETNRLDEMRREKEAAGESGKGAKKLGKEIERQEDLISELRDFEDKLRRAANLHLEPDLNDGVVLNIAPLHELVPWKEAKNYWEELLEVKYEWSSVGKQLRQKGIVK